MEEEVQKHEEAAHKIYRLSESSLMAHTIRAITNLFVLRHLGLEVQIEPDRDKIIEGKAISVLLSYFNDDDFVSARILIRPEASRHLARFCIAHEVYHLLLQLEDYEQLGVWHGGKKMTREEEDACDAFAWHLCRQHNDFYFDNEKLGECRFSDKPANFPGPFRTHDLENIDRWPKPFIMNPSHPFWKPLTT